MFPKALIVSTAHEVVLKNYTKDRYICIRCELEGFREELFGINNRCFPHYETETSGWEHDLNYQRLIFKKGNLMNEVFSQDTVSVQAEHAPSMEEVPEFLQRKPEPTEGKLVVAADDKEELKEVLFAQDAEDVGLN